jgi:hypothetical protein
VPRPDAAVPAGFRTVGAVVIAALGLQVGFDPRILGAGAARSVALRGWARSAF